MAREMNRPVKGVIGILTGGGDVPGLNPAIRAVTIRAIKEGYRVIGIRRGWAGLVEMTRDKDAPNHEFYTELTEEVVNKAGRTGGTFLHTSRTRPSNIPAVNVPAHLRDKYNQKTNDLTDEVLKNLEFLGINYLIPIGGDDTLSYAVQPAQAGSQGYRHTQDHGQRRPGHRLLHRLFHLRHPDHQPDPFPADHGWLPRTFPGD